MGETTTSRTTTTTTDWAGTARWSRLASVGLLMEAAAPILLVAAAVIWGLSIGDELAFFLAPAIAALGASRLIRRERTLWKVLAIVLGLLAALMLFWTAFGLAEPASFFDFMPGVLIVGGLLVTLIAGIGSIRARKRHETSAPHAGEQQAIRTVLVGLGVLAAVSAVLSVTGRETVSEAEARTADLVVDLKDFEYDQATYSTDGAATILIKNSDPFLHTFTIDALDINVELTAGSEKLIELPAKSGTYVLYCKPHTNDPKDPTDDDMAATFKIG